MIRKINISIVALLFVLVTAAAASAQTAPVQEVPNWELYGGFSYVFHQYSPTFQHPVSGGMTGWDGSLKVPVPVFNDWLGVVGDVSGHYASDDFNFNPHQYFFLVGPQVNFHVSRSSVFLHGLVGSSHLASQALPNLDDDNSFAVAVGGGVDLGVSRNFAWRFTGDWYNTHYRATNHNVSEIRNSNGRVSTGPVFRF
ncbi:MAG TPA: outer membrane beta-barrel protein [Terracidiphilus sp.]|nr:outer membrane beta-barrel protein [Terracidiphilus sp.]